MCQFSPFIVAELKKLGERVQEIPPTLRNDRGDPHAIKAVANALRQWRRERGLTQRDTSVALKVTLRTYGRWERGVTPLPAWAIHRLILIHRDAEPLPMEKSLSSIMGLD